MLKMVTPRETQELVSRDPQTILLDVRSLLEYEEKHIKDSVNIPINVLFPKIEEKEGLK